MVFTPPGRSTATVYINYASSDDLDPLQGTVTFQPLGIVKGSAGEVVVLPYAQKVTIGADGHAEAVLACGGDSDYDVDQVVYKCTTSVYPTPLEPMPAFFFELTAADIGDTIDLVERAEVVPVAEYAAYARLDGADFTGDVTVDGELTADTLAADTLLIDGDPILPANGKFVVGQLAELATGEAGLDNKDGGLRVVNRGGSGDNDITIEATGVGPIVQKVGSTNITTASGSGLGVTGSLSVSGAATVGGNASVTGAFSAGSLAVDGSASFARTALGFDVEAYGAVGDGTTDDSAAIQAAIDAAFAAGPGNYALLWGKTYGIRSELRLHPGTGIRGTGGNHLNPNRVYLQKTLKILSGFSGVAAIKMVSQTLGSYADRSCEQRIEGLTIDGNNIGTDLAGVKALGQVHGVYITDVKVQNMTGHGFWGATNSGDAVGPKQPFSWRMNRLVVENCGGDGYNFHTFTDTTMIDCQVIGCQGSGFVFTGFNGSILTNCRAEWCGEHGYDISCYSINMYGCSTDSNHKNGIYLHTTSTGGSNAHMVIAGARLHRDGRNGYPGVGGGDYAAIQIDGHIVPTLISGVHTVVDVGDDGLGANRPQYAIRTTNSTCVTVTDGIFWGVDAGWVDNGGNTSLTYGPNIVEATGNRNARVLSQTRPWTVNRDFTAKSINTTGPALGMATPRSSNNFYCWTCDPLVSGTTGSAMTMGVILLMKVSFPTIATISKAWFSVSAAAVTATAGQNFIGVFNSSGTLLGSAGIDSQIGSTGSKSVNFSSSFSVDVGFGWIGVLVNASTAPQFHRASTVMLDSVNGNRSATNYRVATNGSGLTSMATITPSANVTTSAYPFWAALS